MNFIVYKITNLIDKKIYVGCHETTDLNDSYMGSGIKVRRAIKKYGLHNFKKEILKICESREEMFLEESKIVNEDFITRNDVYNIMLGGYGGWKHITSEIRSRIGKTQGRKGGAITAKLIKEDPLYAAKWKTIGANVGQIHADRLKTDLVYAARNRETVIKAAGGKSFAAKFSSDPILAERYKMMGRDNGKKSAGKIWIHLSNKTKMVLPQEVEKYLEQGWKNGRAKLTRRTKNEIAHATSRATK